jgi:uncharacterized protein YdaU (DUF1376 family)
VADSIDTWMPLWIGDYLADTMHLTTEQHGAYFLLMMAYWKNGGPLANDDDQLAAISKVSVQRWKTIGPVVKRFFREKGLLLTHKRIEEELENARQNKSKRSASGSRGAAKKWGEDPVGAADKAKRSERLAAARKLGKHSPEEWQAMRDEFQACLRCGDAEAELVKDHIKPIYQGGSDAIENIQCLCRSCNAAKGPESVDCRPADWRERLAKRLTQSEQEA